MQKIRAVAAIVTLCFVLLFNSEKGLAQNDEQFVVELSDSIYKKGDSLVFALIVTDSVLAKKALTLNVWIEDVHRTTKWKLRYPILDGQSVGVIHLSENLSDDDYSFNFNVQNGFYDLIGKINTPYKEDSVTGTFLLYDKEVIISTLPVHYGNQFKIKTLLFENSAAIFFSNANPKKKRPIDITLVTPLDSAFIPIFEKQFMVQIGNPMKGVVAKEYEFDAEKFKNNEKASLENVTIYANRKTEMDKLEELYISSGMFKGADGYSFSADDASFIGSTNALQFLTGRVAGLMISQSGADYQIEWRGSTTSLFLDEMPVDAALLSTISASEIGFIKVYRPPFFGAFGGGAGGAIAVYTRKGGPREDPNGPKSKFIVHGYTPIIFSLFR